MYTCTHSMHLYCIGIRYMYIKIPTYTYIYIYIYIYTHEYRNVLGMLIVFVKSRLFVVSIMFALFSSVVLTTPFLPESTGETVFHKYLREYCFVLTEISGNLRESTGECNLGILCSSSLLPTLHIV